MKYKALLFYSILRRNLSLYKILILIFMIFTLPINALDIPLDGLLVLSQFHCFDINICTSPLEYCSSFAKECRPCTEEICAKRDGDGFPLQCNLNCSIADAKIKEAEYQRTFQGFVHNSANVWFLLVVTIVPTIIVLNGCWCKRHSIIRRCKSAFKKTGRSVQTNTSTDEERGLSPQEEITNTVQYCEKTLKGMCETNEDPQKTIATTQDKGLTSIRLKPAPQTDLATIITEPNDSDLTESKQTDDTNSKQPLLSEIEISGLDSAPLKAAPPLDFQTLQEAA